MLIFSPKNISNFMNKFFNNLGIKVQKTEFFIVLFPGTNFVQTNLRFEVSSKIVRNS